MTATGITGALDAAAARMAWATETVERAWLATGVLPAGLDRQVATIAAAVFAATGRAPGRHRITPPPRAALAAAVAALNALSLVDAFAARLLLSRALGVTWCQLEATHGRSKPTLRQHQLAALAGLTSLMTGIGP